MAKRRIIGRPLFRAELNAALRRHQWNESFSADQKARLGERLGVLRGSAEGASTKKKKSIRFQKDVIRSRFSSSSDRLNPVKAHDALALSEAYSGRKRGVLGLLRYSLAGSKARKRLRAIRKIRRTRSPLMEN